MRLPGLLLTGDHDEVIDSTLRAGGRGFERRVKIRADARKAFLEADCEEKMRHVMHSGNRASRGPWVTGNLHMAKK